MKIQAMARSSTPKCFRMAGSAGPTMAMSSAPISTPMNSTPQHPIARAEAHCFVMVVNPYIKLPTGR